MFTATEMATAVRHRIPLVTVLFNDGAFGNVRRIQQGASAGRSQTTSPARISSVRQLRRHSDARGRSVGTGPNLRRFCAARPHSH
jgi:thiamine pyrophosphate-dependent acetolactate synthase large subunit-like protein